jgi:hypothetical protein
MSSSGRYFKVMKTISFLTRVIALLSIVITGLGCAHLDNRSGSGAAIHQVGLVWLNKPGDAEDRQKVINAVHEFARSIPEVKSAAVGPSDGIEGPYTDASYDLCFILTFADEASRQRYSDHPVHQRAAREVFLPLSRKLLFYRFVAAE